MRSARTGAFVILGLAAVGCAPTLAGGEPREASTVVPAQFYRAQSTIDPEQPPTVGTPEATVQKGRVAIFDSAELQSLIEAALRGNQELNGRMQEIIIAQSEVMAREGEYLPRLDGRVAVGVDRVGKYTSQGVSDEAHGVPSILGNFTFGLTSSWEVDIWKKLRNAAKAASLHHRATIEGRNFLVTQLVAEIARSYYELVALDNELEVLQRNIRVQEETLEVIRLQKQAGEVTELAVQRFEAEVLKNKGRLYDVEQERIQTENRINFLVGRYPQPVARDARHFRDPLPPGIRSGLPAQLLGNRPDVRQAELELEAARLDVKAAKAAFYPALSIDAGAGYQSFDAAHLVDTPDSVSFGLEAEMTVPLLNRKGIEAEYRSASARQIQAVYEYEKTVLQAYTEVASQLAMIDNLQKTYDLQAKQVETLGKATETSQLLFQSARADYMEVLLTRRESIEAELELIETRLRQMQARVNVYQALGGGWR